MNIKYLSILSAIMLIGGGFVSAMNYARGQEISTSQADIQSRLELGKLKGKTQLKKGGQFGDGSKIPSKKSEQEQAKNLSVQIKDELNRFNAQTGRIHGTHNPYRNNLLQYPQSKPKQSNKNDIPGNNMQSHDQSNNGIYKDRRNKSEFTRNNYFDKLREDDEQSQLHDNLVEMENLDPSIIRRFTLLSNYEQSEYEAQSQDPFFDLSIGEMLRLMDLEKDSIAYSSGRNGIYDRQQTNEKSSSSGKNGIYDGQQTNEKSYSTGRNGIYDRQHINEESYSTGRNGIYNGQHINEEIYLDGNSIY